MALALETVVKQLTDSGIIAPGKLENFIPPKATPKDGEALLRELHKQGLLTKFQTQQVAASKVKALILGAYTILDRIGAGGMGQVFKAQHRKMDRIVAIKMLPNAMMKDAAAAARFEREVRAAAKLRHTNIVAADDAAEANGVHFLVMEYVEGQDLSALVKKEGPLPVVKAINYILQAARGLEFAHQKGVIHRDIKPANLLLSSDGTVKILDMGLARIESDGNAATEAELTGTGAVMGTVDYMAPEQALKTKTADARADIYSLGCSLYFLLSGKPTYAGDSIMEKLLAHREEPIPSLGDVQANVPKQVETIFRTMVAKRVEDRYQTMSEVVEALEALGFGGSGTGGRDEAAKAWTLSDAARKKLGAKTPKKSSGSLAKAVITHKSTYLVAKLVAGAFATIIAPILVIYIQKYLEKGDTPPNPTAASAGTNAKVDADVRPITNFKDPAFQQWMKDVAAMPADRQVEAVAKKLQELNPGFDGKVTSWAGQGTPQIGSGVVTILGFETYSITDISPVRALTGLKQLDCHAESPRISKLSDLSPLEGMQLTHLSCDRSQVSDLRPLKGMPLSELYCGDTKVSDLSPLEAMSLTRLTFFGTQVFDLSPLQGGHLTSIALTPQNVTKGIEAIRQMKSLTTIGLSLESVDNFPSDEFWRKYDAGEFRKSGSTFKDPAFQQWMKDVAAMPAEEQVKAVAKKLQELNPGFDGKVKGAYSKGNPTIDNGIVRDFGVITDQVTDISPLRVLIGLQEVSCNGSDVGKSKLSDLSPLKGIMPLTNLDCGNTAVSDLSPLKSLKLRYLSCSFTGVSDLGSLEGMPLEMLACNGTQVSDLSPLRGMPLSEMFCVGTNVTDLSPLYDCKSLKFLKVLSTNVTPVGVAALQKALPNCLIEWDGPKPITTFKEPSFQQWMKEVAAMPADRQVEAVKKKLKELNPGFDGKVSSPEIKDGVVTKFAFNTGNVQDISPVRALAGLTNLEFGANGEPTSVSDLSPLEGMKLTSLNVGGTQVSDLSPLQGMPLTNLFFSGSPVSSLAPLKGMPLTNLSFYGAQVSDLSPLKGMSLTSLNCEGQTISDLSPLQDCKELRTLNIKQTKVTPASVAALQKALPNCKIDWDSPKPITTFNDPAFQQWMKNIATMPAEQQVEAVAKKLQELNPGYDGKFSTPKIENGVVTRLAFLSDKIIDISPVRALVGLKQLACNGGTTGVLYDLSPLKEMALTHLVCFNTEVSDLSPLENCKSLTTLKVTNTKVTATSVATLQKALPNCKIDWDDPAKATAPASPSTR